MKKKSEKNLSIFEFAAYPFSTNSASSRDWKIDEFNLIIYKIEMMVVKIGRKMNQPIESIGWLPIGKK